MAAATIEKFIETASPWMEVARIEVSDGETYKSKKFKYVQAAFGCYNEDLEDKYLSICNEDGTELDGTDDTVAISTHAQTDKTMTIWLFGRG